MKAIRDFAKSARSSKLTRFMRGAKNDTPSKAPGKCYAAGGAVGAANNPGPIDGMMAKPRLDRPGRKMDGKKSAGTNVTVVVMPKGDSQPPMPMMLPPNAGPPLGPPGPAMPPGLPQGGPPMMPPKGPMKTGGRVGYKTGGKVHDDAMMDKKMMTKMVHKHESHMHKGEKETKLKRGGACK